MQIAVAPTVFVALGGTGQIILDRLRQRLRHRIGTADLPFFRYLYLDTDEGSVKGAVSGIGGRAAAWSAANLISPSADTITKVQNPQLDNGKVARDLDIDTWFDQHARTQLGTVRYTQGVGGRRMFSRLGFLASQNLGSLEQTLIRFYNELITSGSLRGRPLEGIDPPYLSVVPTSVEAAVRFVVVTSSGGGTGSGCFIDFGFLLRKLRRQHNWGQVHQFGHVALARPGVETQNQQRNTAALLTELDYYDGTQTYAASYLTLTGSPQTTDRNPPYDAAYLVTGTQQHVPLAGERAAAFDGLLWRMAEYLVADSIGDFDDADRVPPEQVALPRSGPVGAIAFLGDVGLNPSGLQTYGVACREWPAALVHRQLYGQVIRQVADHWTKPQDARAQEVSDRLRGRLGIPGDAVQKNADPRNPAADPLKDALLQPINDLDPVRQLHRIRETAYDEKGRVALANLTRVQGNLRQQFVQRAGVPANAEDPGVTYGILQTNLTTLLNETDPKSLPRQVTDELLNLCVDANGGPATALQAAQALRGAVGQERAYLGECLQGLQPSSPERPQNLEQCWQYANDALLQQLLFSKNAVYEAVDRWLERLVTRLGHFTTYVQQWAGTIQGSTETLPNDVPSLVIPPHVVQRLEQALRSGVTADLGALEGERVDRAGIRQPGLMASLRGLAASGFPAQDSAARATLFAEGVPTEQGAPDFSYLQHLERAIFIAIASSPASPYREEILALLEQEANRANTPIPDLMAQCEPLVNYETGAVEYATLPFGGNPTHVSEIVQPNQAGYPAFQAAQTAGRAWLTRWQSVGAVKEVQVSAQVTPGLNTRSVTFVAERCSIRSEFVSGYGHEARRTLFGLDNFPALSDRRIRLAPDPAAVRRGHLLLIGSVILKQWVYLGGPQPYHELTYTLQDPQTGFALTRTYHASQQVPVAMRNLADAPEVMTAIERKAQAYLQANAGAASTLIDEAIREINKITQAQPPVYKGDLLRWNLYQVDYGAAVSALLQFARQFGIPLAVPDHEYARFVPAGDLQPGPSAGERAAQDGWYCTRCGYSFGFNMPLRSGEGAGCPRCKNPAPVPAEWQAGGTA